MSKATKLRHLRNNSTRFGQVPAGAQQCDQSQPALAQSDQTGEPPPTRHRAAEIPKLPRGQARLSSIRQTVRPCVKRGEQFGNLYLGPGALGHW